MGLRPGLAHPHRPLSPAPNVSALPALPRPRLGIDFHVWDQLFQGSRSHLLGLYRAAIPKAPELDFVFFLNDPESLRQAHAEFRLPQVHLVAMPHRPGPWRLAVQLPWLQWRHRIDLLHMQYRLPLLPAGPCACTIHDVLFETHPQFFPKLFTWQSRLSYRHATRRAALLMTVSEFSRQEIARHYGVPAGRIALTPNAVDPQRFFPGAAGAETVRALGLVPGGYLLTVGRLEPRKNHLTLIEAYARLGAGAPPLAIVGQRDFHFHGALDAIERLGLQDRVKLLESVDDAALPAVLRHARLFAYPSFAEGFGMPVLEAMACGVPVITTNTTSLPEVAGDAAWCLPPDAVPALTDALQTLLAEPARCARMASAGLAQARQFSWDHAADALLAGVRAHLAPPQGTRHAAI